MVNPSTTANPPTNEMKTKKATTPRLREIEIPTAEAWLASGAITETGRGDENTYYRDQFGAEFFCKNYPKPEPEQLTLVVNGEQVWTNYGGKEQQAICPTETWAEDLAKIALAWIDSGLDVQTTLNRLGFKPCN